jgi:hypothetical protein
MIATAADPDLHMDGQGVKTNLIEAYKWFDVAASSGHEDAHFFRAAVAARISSDDRKQAHQLAQACSTRTTKHRTSTRTWHRTVTRFPSMKTLQTISASALLLLTTNVAMADLPMDFCFQKISSEEIKVVALHKGRFQVIPRGGADNQVEWFTERNIRKGDTLVTKGGQLQAYVEFQDLVKKKIRVHQYGWARGVGTVDQIKEVLLTDQCK